MRPANPVLWLLLAGLGAWLLSGCNLFSPLASDSTSDLTYRGLLLKGNEAINNGDYAEAEGFFYRALKLNYRGSEAYLFHSKALASEYKIDYNTLNTEFNSRRNKDGLGKKGIPFIDSNTSVEKIDSTYYPVAQSVENLEHILRHQKDTVLIPGGWKLLPDGDTAGDGRVTEGVARLDLGLLQTIKGMLGPLDLDGDNHVTRECGRNICPGLDAGCMAGAAYKAKCKEGPASEINGFERFKLLTKSIDINNLDTKDVRARQVSSDPNDINDFLDKMQGPIAASSFNLDSVTGAMNAHKEGKLSGQLDEIVTNVSDLGNFLSYMRYNDFLDNDFDDQDSSGKGDRMVWHDYNKDGGIVFNYSDTLTFIGYTGTGRNGECQNIGHPLHRYLHPELYYKFTDSAWAKRKISGDTSKNSRKSIMINHCVDVAQALDINGKVDTTLKIKLMTQTCFTFTSILKSTVRPPARSDWISGTFGVDEEEFDDRDNDYDGIKDEDSRNARGMDDDDDAILSTDMIGKPSQPAPMVWSDVPGHANQCPDIDTTKAMLAPPFQRQFCIGSLEHRIYLSQHGGKDTLSLYYSRFLGEGPNQNCLDDFDKLPETYKTAVGLHSSSDDAVQDACQFKHIWKKGIPPNSEWASGVFGIDEEVPDGVDNDGDGWIDEDVK
jgi:hypothetical protein